MELKKFKEQLEKEVIFCESQIEMLLNGVNKDPLSVLYNQEDLVVYKKRLISSTDSLAHYNSEEFEPKEDNYIFILELLVIALKRYTNTELYYSSRDSEVIEYRTDRGLYFQTVRMLTNSITLKEEHKYLQELLSKFY